MMLEKTTVQGMKEIVFPGFTKREKTIISLLIAIGISRRHSLVLVFLADRKEVSSRDVERGTNLRQPEVSIVMKDLKNRGWVLSRVDRSAGRGRPIWRYCLATPFRDILDEIEKEKEDEAKKIFCLFGKVRLFW